MEVRNVPTPAASLAQTAATPIRVEGKFFFQGTEKHFVRGVTYGPFPPGEHGFQFPDPRMVERDFTLMAQMGVNTLRVFTLPPTWLLDMAAQHGLKVMVGVPWAQHIAFLDSARQKAEIRRTMANAARSLAGHPGLFSMAIGNEIPPDMVRWHGPKRVAAFLSELAEEIKQVSPTTLVNYANFPSTEYLTTDFTDFLSFNIYLHNEDAFRRYVGHLHNLAVDRPLVLTEFGIDSIREGAQHQAEILSWQVKAAFEMGCAGTFVFAWTDEWFTGGHMVEDWAFGLVTKDREKKPAYYAVEERYKGVLPPQLPEHPRVSVVVCAYNAERTMDQCLASLEHLNYPNYEVIVVNDGSTDRTLEIAEKYDYVRIISQENKGLSVARNVGMEAATGDIIAYTDSDCVADPDWLTYMVAKFQSSGLHAVGGPNFPPPEDSLVPSAVAVSPGGPTHVLISDDIAEHIAGCNMAFTRQAMETIGGFDPQFRAAGDDIDYCWRLQNAGYQIGFAPAAVVWHFRRNTVEDYLKQQKGYGKAEAMVYAKHPYRFNLFGQARWLGRIYGDFSASFLFSRKPVIYSGVLGRGLFQTLYEPPSSLAAYLPLTLEWNIIAVALFLWGALTGGLGWLGVLPLLMSVAWCLAAAWRAPVDPRFNTIRARLLIAALIYLGPILRSWERIRWRVRDLTKTEPDAESTEIEFRPAISWRERAFTMSFWTEAYEIDKENLVQGVIDFLLPRKYFLMVDQGWSDWDLKVSRGLWARAQVRVCSEYHGGPKKMLKVRCALRVSRLGTLALRAYAGLFLLTVALGVPQLMIGVGLAAALHAGVIVHQNIRLGRVLANVFELVGREVGLLRVRPSMPSPAAAAGAAAPTAPAAPSPAE